MPTHGRAATHLPSCTHALQSTGEVQLKVDIKKERVAGRHVILVEVGRT